MLGVLSMSAQAPKAVPPAIVIGESLRNLHLPEPPGAVPIDYVPAAKDRATEYQQSLEPAYAWYEEQLGVHVPIVLYVLDRESYVKVKGSPWPMPYSLPRVADIAKGQANPNFMPAAVVFPMHIEDLVGEEPNAKTPGEYITYHEAGHDFAYALKIFGAETIE
jgi:hypothetical protein